VSALKTKIEKLPTWARQHIAQLEQRCDPANREMNELRRRLESAEKWARLMTDRCEAMVAIMQAAGQGGHETAAAFIDRVLNEWELVEERT
jgi:hypothetical protein